MKLRDQRENTPSHRHIRPNQEQIHAHIQSELLRSGIRNWQLWEESLLSLWEEAIDSGLDQENAREKLDETMRGVITYQRLNLAVMEQRNLITSLFAHMSREIKEHVQVSQGDMEAPPSREEQRQRERQHQRDDDPNVQRKADEARGQHERRMRQHRANSAGNTTPGVATVF